MFSDEIKKYLDALEADIKPLDEFKVGEEIARILGPQKDRVTDPEDLAEFIAFRFMPNYNGRNVGWGTYYGPMLVMKNDKGQFVEFPSLQHITPPVIKYWKERNESPHPILARQYADLVLEFEPKVLGVKFDYILAQKVIDKVLEICTRRLDDSLGSQTKLLRALDLAKKINDSARIEKLKGAIINTENAYAEDSKPGLWGYAFEWLALDDSGKVKLTDTELGLLISGLEDRLDRLMATEDPNPWHVEHAIELLTQFYSRSRNEKKIEELLMKLETAFKKNKHANSDGLLVTNYLEKLLDLYSSYSSSFPFAKKAYDRVLQELSSPEAKQKFEGHEISVEMKIPQEEIERFTKAIFNGDQEPRHIEKVLAKLAVNFITKKDRVEKQLKGVAQDHPLQFLMGGRIISDDGYTIAEMGSLEEDYDQRLLDHFSKNLHFETAYLHIAFRELRKRFTPEQVYAVLALSPVFRDDDKEYILKLMREFWEGDYLVASALSVPLIEDAVRNLFRLNNLTFIKRNRNGTGFDVLSLGELFQKGVLKQVFQALGENLEYYLRAVLTERVGWNLRNNFAHGINKSAFVEEEKASRLLHILFCLALIRKVPNPEAK